MANEVYVSAQGDTLATHIFVRELEMLLHQKPFMRRLCSYKGDTRGSNSATLKIGQVDHDDIAEAVAEGSNVSDNTAITDASYTLTPARKVIKRVLSNLLAGVDGTGLMKEVALANYNFAAVMKKFDADVATALASLTGTAGSTGVDMKASDWFTAQQTLRTRRAAGKKAAVLEPTQFNDLQNDLRGEVGPWQLDMDVQAAVASTSGENFIGTLNGIEIWLSDQVADANGGNDHGGGMFEIPTMQGPDGRMVGPSAIAYAEGSPEQVSLAGGRLLAPGGVVYTTIQDVGDSGDVAIWTNYFEAVSVAEAGRGIKIITDHS